MKKINLTLVLLYILFLTNCNTKNQTSKERTTTVLDSIKKVEHSLTTPIYIEGDSTWHIEDRLRHYGIPGVSIAIIHNGEIAWAKGYGVMDKDSNRPVTEETLFQAAATTMPVTAYGALCLVEEQRLDLDNNINSYLESWKVPDNDFTKQQHVTIKNLLNHSAGIHPRGTGRFNPDDKIPTLLDILNGRYPAANEAITVNKVPSESVRFAYASYVPIQQLMLDVSGKTFPKLMNELVLQPLDMTNSTFNQPLTEVQLAKAATGYLKDGSMAEGRSSIYPSMASYGLWTTPTDYAKFLTHVQQTLKGKPSKGLSKELTTLMGTPYGVENNDWSFTLGLGFQLLNRNNDIYLRHHGWNRGFYAEFRAHRDKGYGAVVMTNSTFPEFNAEVFRAVASAYGWDNHNISYKKINTEQSFIDKIVGRYQSEDTFIDVFQKDNQLFYKNIIDEEADELVKVSDSNFVKRTSVSFIQFKPDTEHKTFKLVNVNRRNGNVVSTLSKVTNSKKHPIEVLLEGDFENTLSAFENLKKHHPEDPTISETFINDVGYQFLFANRRLLAHDTFKLNMLLYPESHQVYISYADACNEMGKHELAILNYRKSLELQPQNNEVRQKLDRLLKK